MTNTTALPDLFGTYNVGASGVLSPLPGTDSGYYVARVRIIDQSGNQSNPNDPNAQVPFVVDNTPPTATFTSPTSGQVITSLTNGQIQFTFTTNKNIDLTHFNASSIAAHRALVPTASSAMLMTSRSRSIPARSRSLISIQGTGGSGAEQISFTTRRDTLTNNLYAVVLLNTGTDAVRDIAGNVLASPMLLRCSRLPCPRWPRTCMSRREPTGTTRRLAPARIPILRSARP